jgi:hypothetical protein
MNNKIKELVEKSGLYIAYDNREVTDKEIEFFAELIINECMDAARKYTLEHSGLSESYNGKVLVCEAIKEHFGNVKEQS